MATVRPATQDDLERIISLTTQAFNIPRSSHPRMREDAPLNIPTFRVLEERGKVQACMRAVDMGHFYGGSAVRAAGIASVAVAAEGRGRGFGSTLMREALVEQRDRGVPVSSLYPATVPIYRQCGYGFGSTRSEWKVRLADLPARATVPADIDGFSLDGYEPVNALYEEIARTTNGLVQRDKLWWQKRVFTGWDDAERYGYVVREDGRATGYIVYSLASTGESWRSTLRCHDLFWRTPAAARTLLSLAAMHRSTSEWMEWLGPPDEPLQLLMSDHAIALDHQFRTMIRILDVAAAFEARGYARGVERQLTFAVSDPTFPDNAGPWRLEVAAGAGKIDHAETADAEADIQTWGALWTGLLAPRDAIRVGALRARDEVVDALEVIFAGPAPWISDFF